MSTELEDNGWSIKVGNFKATIPSLALVMMIGGILFPAVYYSANLRDPTPASLLVAICVSVFASVIYLWILDVTNILTFRHQWISKSIYGAAIASILGSSVAVYKDFFDSEKYPLRGKWQVSVINSRNKSLSQNELLIGYSENSDVYYGFSDVTEPLHDTSGIAFIEVKSLSVKDKIILFQLGHENGKIESFQNSFRISENQKQIFINRGADSTYNVLISRPNY